jgi:hypothetical protein
VGAEAGERPTERRDTICAVLSGLAPSVVEHRRRAAISIALAAMLGVALYMLVVGPPPAPGFIRDEASVSYNAYTLSQNLRDQNGGAVPLYIKSFGDYKSPLFVYALAGVFRVTGPSRSAAIATAGTVVAAAVLLLGLLAWRRTRSLFVTTATVILAGLTPWLFELGRFAVDTAIEPLAIVALLLALNWSYTSRRGVVVRALPVAVALAALAYSYAAGRLLSPLWAAALLVFAGRGRWRWLLATWGIYVLAMLPLVVYSFVHTDALSARYQATTFIQDGMSTWTIAGDFVSHYVHDVNLWHWIVSGDLTPYIHVAGAAQLFASTVVLALIGVFDVVRHRWHDRFWRFVVAALLLAPMPAALTEDRYYSLRLLPIPLLLGVLAIPGLDVLRRAAQKDWPGRFVLAALTLLVAVQFGEFLTNYNTNNGGRATLFEHDVPPLLTQAFAGGRTVYVDHDDVYAQTHALWYAATHDIATSRMSILPDGGMPPIGSIAFGRLQTCDYSCTHLADADTYWIARVNGPKAG